MRFSAKLYKAIQEELAEECKRFWGEGYQRGYATAVRVLRSEKDTSGCKSPLAALADNEALQSAEKGIGRTHDIADFLGSLKDAEIKMCGCCGHIAATLHYCPHCGSFVESKR